MLCLKNQRVGIGVESLSNRQLMVLLVLMMVRETSMRDIKILILLKRFKQMLKKKNESISSKYTDDVELDNELPPRSKDTTHLS